MSTTGIFIRNIIAPLWAWRENSPYLRHLHTVQAMQRRGDLAIRDEQLLRLQKLVRHSFANTEFYHTRFVEAGITPDSIVALSDLARLPLVCKDDIRANKEQMVSRSLPKEKLIPRKTSGSTGVSLE
jgi:phenylacetate-CoA ligase